MAHLADPHAERIMTADPIGPRAGHASTPTPPPSEALRDTARALRVTAHLVSGAIRVYDAQGHESIGRLHCNPSGWRGIEDLTGEATVPCATDVDALVALSRRHASLGGAR